MTPVRWCFASVANEQGSPRKSGANDVRLLHFAGYLAHPEELAAELGLSPQTPDSELVLAAYRRFGTATAARLEGAAAWVVWDPREKAVLAVRDRIGQLGLYFVRQRGQVLVSERVEDLLSELDSFPPLNVRSLVAHLHGRPQLPGETFFEGVEAVRPGTVVRFTEDGYRTEVYWELGWPEPLRLGSDEEYAEALRCELFRVVPQYVRSEPLGITLSSGLDSTTVAASTRVSAPQARVTAFSWAMPGLPAANEIERASEVAARLGIDLVSIEAEAFWPLKSAAGFGVSAGSPFRHFYSELWEHTFAEMAARGLRTIFTGTSGDDLFGASVAPYADFALTGRWGRLARELRAHVPHSRIGLRAILSQMLLRPLLRSLLPTPLLPAPSPAPWLGAGFRGVYREFWGRRPRRLGLSPGRAERHEMLSDPHLGRVAEASGQHAAAHGLQLVHPLLDHRLLDFAMSLPPEQTFRAARNKIIVRNAMRPYLPTSVIEAPRKTYPVDLYRLGLRERETARVWELLTDMEAARMGFVNEAQARKAFQQFLEGRPSGAFWHAITLEDWLRRYVIPGCRGQTPRVLRTAPGG